MAQEQKSELPKCRSCDIVIRNGALRWEKDGEHTCWDCYKDSTDNPEYVEEIDRFELIDFD